MLKTSYIIENKKEVIESLKKRNFKSEVLIDELISFDNERKVLQTDYESKLSKSNSISKTIGQLFKDGKKDETVILKEESLKIKQETKLLSEKLNDVKTKIDNILYQIPNVPNKNVPTGNTQEDNVVIFESDLNINPNSNILEIRNPQDKHNNAYFSLASALDLNYYYLYFDHNENVETLDVKKLNIQIEALDHILERLN